MIHLFCHSDFHLLDGVILWRIEQLRFVAYTDESFQNLSVQDFQFQKVAFNHLEGALQLLENLYFSSFDKKHTVKLGL